MRGGTINNGASRFARGIGRLSDATVSDRPNVGMVAILENRTGDEVGWRNFGDLRKITSKGIGATIPFDSLGLG